MRTLLLTIGCMGLLIVFTQACKQQEDLSILPGNTPLLLKAKMARQQLSENDSSPWVNGQEFGLYMLESGKGNLSGALESNRRYVYDDDVQEFRLSGEPIYYPEATSVDLIAYSPYQEGTNGEFTVDLTDQSNPTAIDILYSNKTVDFSSAMEPVSIAFEHLLSKINFIIVPASEEYPANLQDIQISLQGFPSEATANLLTGQLYDVPSANNTIDIVQDQSAIIMPDRGKSGRIFQFVLGASKWTYTLPYSENFEKGKEYTYTVTVHAKNLHVQRSTIKDWAVNNKVTTTSDLQLVPIRPGTFYMGSGFLFDPYSQPNERPRHLVKFEEAFYMSKYPITVQQYCDFLNTQNLRPEKDKKHVYGQLNGKREPFMFFNDLPHPNTPYFKGGEWLARSESFKNYPINLITPQGALAFARWVGGDIPTEAQWEYACRAGTTTPWSFGDKEENLKHYVYTNPSGNGHEASVGSRLPNYWGLYDMHGLVAEWCYSVGKYPSGASTEQTAVTHPVPEGSVLPSILRGRGPLQATKDMRSAFRLELPPDNIIEETGYYVGFRIVINPKK